MVDAQKAPLETIDISNRLSDLRNFVACAIRAAGHETIEPTDRDAIQVVLDHVMRGLDGLSEEIHPSKDNSEA